MKRIASVLTACFLFFITTAQRPASWTSSDMYLALRKLNVLGSVLYIAAHPDDENTRLIAYLSKEKLYRTGYMALTRGDGGQNLIGDEQGIELGLIRTQELLAARRIDGGEQFFSRAFDFGFSKGPEETFTKWDKEKILSDVVWVIRNFQPDVIITRFPTTGEGGHGHHTASAILANEAFTAAADPNRFPEQLKYVKPWQAKRILWNTFNFGSINTTSNSQFKFDVGGYNPLLGKSYGEIAAESRSQHKSQGFGVPASRGEAWEYFKTTGGTPPENDLMDDVDITWNRVPGGAAIASMIEKLSSSFDLLHTEKSVPGLVKLYQAMQNLPDGYWKKQKLKETKQLIEQCSGLWMEAYSNNAYAVQTDSVRISFSFNDRLGVNAILKNITVDQFDSTLNEPFHKNENIGFSKLLFVPASKSITQPYWLVHKMEEGYYNVTNQQKIGQADVDPAYIAQITVNIEGQDFTFSKPVKYKFTDPVKGEIYQPLVVVPPVTAGDLAPFYLKNKKDNVIDVRLIANTNVSSDTMPESNTAITGQDTLSFAMTYHLKKNSQIDMAYPVNELQNKTYRVALPDQETAMTMRSIMYDHIPAIHYFKEAVTTVRELDLKTYGKKIGYIVGAGDKVPEALEQMGYDVTFLDDKSLSRNNLQQFDAIIAGVRAYNTDEWLNAHYEQLMKYVNDGGNLIVQYNTSSQIGPVRAKIGPYNFDITRTRVTDENAVVTVLKPDHPVLNFPNKINSDDFKGWIQERSIYHAANWDPHFETIFSMHDKGEAPDEGSLIIAKYGKGYFTYTGLVFYRELPAGVPGAYRLMANLIALNKKKAF